MALRGPRPTPSDTSLELVGGLLDIVGYRRRVLQSVEPKQRTNSVRVIDASPVNLRRGWKRVRVGRRRYRLAR